MGHAPLLAELGPGDVTMHGVVGVGVDPITRYRVSWDLVEVLPDLVTILV
jgi:hypothetical protein